MSRLETTLRSISADLSGCHARWALVGGLAVSARCEPRFTRDVDLAVAASGVVVDLLFASSGIEPEIVAFADRLEIFPGLELPVAAVGDLIALKLLARDDIRRPQDGADLVSLIAVASNADLARAADAVALIVARGYQRDRELASDLRRLLGPGRGGRAGGA